MAVCSPLPVLSACGVEAAVLPSAVLSTHTGGGFAGYTFRDLTADMPAIAQHWQKEGFRFDAVYTGYLGSGEQITHVRHIMDTLLVPGGARIVDPAMADNGKLYAGFDAAFVEKMKALAFSADILLPNITEAALLTGMEYRKEYDEAYIEELTAALHEKGVGTVVLTGVSYEPETTGEEKKEPDEAAQPALDLIRETLGAKVDGVKASTRLKTHPVCLTCGEGLTFEMEKYFTAVQPDLGLKAKRILEVNTNHPAFAALESARETDPEKAKKYAEILYQQACLIAGLPIENPSDYTDLLCSLW